MSTRRTTESSVGEQWKPVIGYERLYAVSDQGRVARIGRTRGAIVGRLRSVTYGRNGPSINLWRNNQPQYELVHIMVARAFIGDIPEGHEVRHKNGDVRDNRAANLEIVPLPDGMYGPGLRPKHKVSVTQVREIRRRYAAGEHRESIARDLGISESAVRHIIKGRTWKHV